MNWTPDKIKNLKKLWQKGKSASEIGKSLGMSKNAIVGKIHRLEAAERPAKKTAPKKVVKVVKTAPKKVVKPTPKKVIKKEVKKVVKSAPKKAAPAKKQPTPKPVKVEKKSATKAKETVKTVSKPTPAAKPVPATKTAQKIEQKNVQAPTPIAKPTTKSKTPTSLMELKLTSCRWPMGDPSDADFHFCGQPAQTGKPYCPEHCKMAYISLRELTLQNAKNKREKAKAK